MASSCCRIFTDGEGGTSRVGVIASEVDPIVAFSRGGYSPCQPLAILWSITLAGEWPSTRYRSRHETLFLAAICVSGFRISLRCWHHSLHASRGNQLGSSSDSGLKAEGRLGLISVLSLSCLSLLLVPVSVRGCTNSGCWIAVYLRATEGT